MKLLMKTVLGLAALTAVAAGFYLWPEENEEVYTVSGEVSFTQTGKIYMALADEAEFTKYGTYPTKHIITLELLLKDLKEKKAGA